MKTSGPLFNGAAAAMIPLMMDDITEEIAEAGLHNVRMNTSSFVNPTGYWESQLDVSPYPGGGHRVHPGGLPYDRWLEGVSSRNQTTRFKGYHVFRDALTQLRREVPSIAAPIVAQWIARMAR